MFEMCMNSGKCQKYIQSLSFLYIQVKWQNGSERAYRFGYQGQFDLEIW